MSSRIGHLVRLFLSAEHDGLAEVPNWRNADLASGTAQQVVKFHSVRGVRWVVTIVGAVSGVCFAALAARSISVLAITPHSFRASSFVVAVISACLSYVAFRAATSGRTDEESFLRALVGGVGGSVVALIVIVVAYVMIREAARAYFAHAIGLHFSQVTNLRLLVALLMFGFAAGFVLRTLTLRDK